MMSIGKCVLLTISILTFFQLKIAISTPPQENYDEWAIEVTKGIENKKEVVNTIAKKLGLELVRSISDEHMPEFFHLRAEKDLLNQDAVTELLFDEPEIVYAEFQVQHEVETKKIDDLKDFLNMKNKKSYYHSSKCQCHKNSPDQDHAIPTTVFETMNNKNINMSMRYRFNDFRWPCQWQLYNCGQTGGPNEYDLDIAAVWDKGITGKGMVVAIVDDGVDYNNIDIAPNYDKNASFDFVEYPDSDGPLPYSDKPHGTYCAGVVGMAANNGYCGVGVVHDAKIGGLRMIGHKSTDVREAAALIYNANYIDVSSNSWGPSDNGHLFRKPPRLTATSLQRGAEHGRNGKGNIYLFASGNGGLRNDHCGADGFSCNIYTISIASSSRNGLNAIYSEQCTCIMATLPSTDTHSNPFDYDMMITTSLHNGCVNNFRGTSSVTPLASSVATMVLQANPALTWRDVQHLIAHTALVVDPNNDNWQINGAGFHVHTYYGFGALNALHITTAAETWINVDRQRLCKLQHPKSHRVIPSGGTLTIQAQTNGCQDTENQVLKLEHVQVVISYDVKCRGDISVRIKSPCGTISQLMNTRRLDDKTLLIDWPYMSVFHWGEDPRGTWTLEITDNKGTARCTRYQNEDMAGHMWKYELLLWGVKEQTRRNLSSPVCDRKQVRDYMENKNPRDKHFLQLIKAGKVTDKKIIRQEFVEDFSEVIQTKDENLLQPRPPGPPKSKPYQTPFQRVAMSVWRKTFHGTESKSLALASYAVDGVQPHKDLIQQKHFEVVRNKIADSLIDAAQVQNDDGERIIRGDLHHYAKALISGSKTNKLSLPKKEAALIFKRLSLFWN
ncbi:PC3-like endoprotease variant B [Styela clava]